MQYIGSIIIKVIDIFLIFLLWSFILEAISINLVGSRTDLLSLSLGIFFFEAYLASVKKSYSRIFLYGFMGFFVVIGISEFLSATRDRTAIEYTFIEGIVRDDYFGPSQILFTAINYNYIDPLKVIISNISNSLIY